METNFFCPFLPICGPAPILQRLARQAFPRGEDYIAMVCNGGNKYLECKHYRVWIELKEIEKNETK